VQKTEQQLQQEQQQLLEQQEAVEAEKIKVPEKPRPLHSVPSMWPVGKFDDLNSELNDIMEASNHCFTGFQFGLTSFINANFMCGHMLHAGKKEENKFGPKEEDSSGWAFHTGIKNKRWTLSGRYSKSNTRVMVQCETFLGMVQLNASLAEQVERSNWEFDWYCPLGQSTFMFKTQSLLFYTFSWTRPVWPGLYLGSEVQLLAPFQHSPVPQTRLKFLGKYFFGNKDLVCVTVGTGTLKKPEHQFGLGYYRQVTDIFDVACSYELTSNESKIKSLLKAGYSLRYDVPNGFAFLARGCLDSTMKFVCLVEKPTSDGLALSYTAKYDVPKNNFEMGVGVTMNM
jgi:hypothetical protein